MRYIYFIGTAGSGKSTLVQAFREWTDSQGIGTITVNLDPGAEQIPYEPDVDIRDWIRLDEIMSDHSLGPNGAQVLASDLMAVHAREWVPVVKKMETDYALIDTPGQMELFAFRRSSSAITEELGQEDGFLVFLSDPGLAKAPDGFVSDMMLSAIVQFRFSLPLLNVLSKADMLTEEELERLSLWASDPYALNNAVTDDGVSSRSVMSVELIKALESAGAYKELTPVSSAEGMGMEDIYSAIQQYFGGGEDLGRNVS